MIGAQIIAAGETALTVSTPGLTPEQAEADMNLSATTRRAG
jgi:hypothetical protein